MDESLGRAELEVAPGSAETRIRLLDAAIQIASRQGIDKVTSRAVGDRTGMSHSLVRFYFGSVDAMITEALERAAHIGVAAAGQTCTGSVDTFGSHIVDTVASEQALHMLQFDYLLRAVRGGVPIERVAQLYDTHQTHVAATLNGLGIADPDQSTTALVFAALEGLALHHAIYGSERRTNAALGRLREVLRSCQATANQDEPR